jgi:hypothetical protein
LGEFHGWLGSELKVDEEYEEGEEDEVHGGGDGGAKVGAG